MFARCKKDNQIIDFKARKGAKLSKQKCECGGSYERLSHTPIPVELTDNLRSLGIKMHFVEDDIQFFYPLKNNNDELFFNDWPNRRVIPLPTNKTS